VVVPGLGVVPLLLRSVEDTLPDLADQGGSVSARPLFPWSNIDRGRLTLSGVPDEG
jgi:hypothetical protein